MSTRFYVARMGEHQWSANQEALLLQLRNLRLSSEMTQQQLSALLNKPQSYVSKYERGERRLDILELRDICRACGIPLHVFVKRLEDKLDAG